MVAVGFREGEPQLGPLLMRGGMDGKDCSGVGADMVTPLVKCLQGPEYGKLMSVLFVRAAA